jgi:uncharacterized protein DUF5060
MRIALCFVAVALAPVTGLPAQGSPAPRAPLEQYRPHDFTFTAPSGGNPFEVELSGEFTGPDGVRLRVPGFYDGAGVWKIRFAPTRQGSWSLRVTSSLKALDGRTETGISCGPNRRPAVHGALRVDPAHPHHFVWEDGTRYFLLGYEADWLWGRICRIRSAS